MTRAEVISKVKSCMDELTPFSDELILSDSASYQKPIESYIEKMLDESGDFMQMVLPDHLLKPELLISGGGYLPEIFHRDDDVGIIELPDSYLRLSYLKFPEWDQPVYKHTDKDSRIGRMQFNKHLRGGYAKPIAVIDTDNGVKKLRCYSISPNHPYPITTTCKIITSMPAENLSDKVIELTAWKTAENVFRAMGEENYAKAGELQLTKLTEAYV